MKKLFQATNDYIKQSDWKTFALLKFCLCSMGILLGLAAPKKIRKPLAFTAMAVFVTTWIPSVLKFLHIAQDSKQQEGTDICE